MGVQTVIFSLGKEEYGMPIEVVREITRLAEVRPIPEAPAYVQGLINLRGKALPVIDLHTRFGVPAPAREELDKPGERTSEGNSLALIAEVAGALVGFAVDKVLEVSILDNILPPPPLVTAPFIAGIVNLPNRIIMQLAPEKILDPDELQGLVP